MLSPIMQSHAYSSLGAKRRVTAKQITTLKSHIDTDDTPVPVKNSKSPIPAITAITSTAPDFAMLLIRSCTDKSTFLLCPPIDVLGFLSIIHNIAAAPTATEMAVPIARRTEPDTTVMVKILLLNS
jgi:hypothetical protein